MSDLIERLSDPKERVYPDDLMDEAVDEIERLQARVVELEAVLRKIADEWLLGFCADCAQFQHWAKEVIENE